MVYHPSSSSSSSSASSHYPYQYGSKQEPKKTDSSSSSMDFFLGQSQPGFPSTCLRVRDHSTSSSSVSSDATNMDCTSSSGNFVASKPVGKSGSVSSCLGPEWPGLGLTVGSSAKRPEATLPNAEVAEDLQLFGQKELPAPPGVDTNRNMSHLEMNFPTMSGESNRHQRSQNQQAPPHGLGLAGVCDQKPTSISQLLCGGGDNGMGDGSKAASSSALLAAAGMTAASSISSLWRSQAPLSVSGRT